MNPAAVKAPVMTITPHLSNIECPEPLRHLQGWLLWRFEQHEGEPKPRKVPYYASGRKRHGVQGRPEDREQMVTFDAARAAAIRGGFDGVGFAPHEDFGIVVLDFDHCVVDGRLHPDVERLVSSTYAEYSPSGKGIHAVMRGALGNGKAMGEPYGVEAFSSKGFVTFTGNRLPDVDLLGLENTVAPVDEAVQQLCAARLGARATPADDDPLMTYEPRLGLTDDQIREALDVLPNDLDYEHWLAVGMAIHHETDGEGFELWEAWSARSPKHSTREHDQGKWDSFGKGGQRPVTSRSLVMLARAHGAYINIDLASPDEFDAVTATPGEKLRFAVQPVAEFAAGPHPGWIIKGVLPRAELVVVFGASGSGKSFVVLDMAAAIARGEPWRGHRTRQGRVVYIMAEGGGGYRKRVQAYAQHHGIDLATLDLGVIHAVPNLLQKADALDVAKAVEAFGPTDVVVVDTFAQVTPGANENAGEDIGKALSHCRGIHRKTGATVLLVHHSGKDAGKGARGWSGLRAAADAEIEVLASPAGRSIRVSKQKDGDDQGEWGFELTVVPVGIDEDGDVIDSCVVTEASLPVLGRTAKPVGKWERLVLDVVGEIALAQSEGIEIDGVVAEVVRRSPKPEDGRRDTRRQHARRAVMLLCEGDDAPFFAEDGCLSVLR